MSVTSVMLIRAKAKADKVAAVDAAARKVFAALEQDPPKGMRYAASKLSDGVTYVILLGFEEGAENPLPSVPAYSEFMGNLQGWLAEAPSQEQLTVVGSYNLF